MTRTLLILLFLLCLPVGAHATAAEATETAPTQNLNLNSNSKTAAPLYSPQDGVTARIGGTGDIFFAYPITKTLSQSYFKLTGIDLGDDKLIDDFAAAHFCDIMKQYYADEFSWRQAREAVRNFITRNLEDYPEHFAIKGTINLGRYDFGKKAFLLEGESELRRTGVFRIRLNDVPRCGNYSLQSVPYNYTFRLTNPITLSSIEMPENKAFGLTRKMESEGNQSRTVYVTFFLRVNDFSSGIAGSTMMSNEATVRATMLAMRVYYDPARTIMIYEYTGE